MRALLLALLLAFPLVGRAADGDDHVIHIDKNDQEMLAAFA